jgi:hypothetical protein
MDRGRNANAFILSVVGRDSSLEAQSFDFGFVSRKIFFCSSVDYQLLMIIEDNNSFIKIIKCFTLYEDKF